MTFYGFIGDKKELYKYKIKKNKNFFFNIYINNTLPFKYHLKKKKKKKVILPSLKVNIITLCLINL